MPWIIGGAAIGGDLLSMFGQQSANAQMESFNAEQAQLNRDFQVQQTQQVEGYDTQMSNTAMQRRVADLKAAGINPMYGIQSGAASSPTVSAPGGDSASVNLGNPMGSFANMGTNAAAAEQNINDKKVADANVSQATSNAEKAHEEALYWHSLVPGAGGLQSAQTDAASAAAEASRGSASVSSKEVAEIQSRIDNLIPAQVEQLRANAKQSDADAQLARAQLPEIVARINNMKSESDYNAALTSIAKIDDQTKRALFPYVKQIESNNAARSMLGMQDAENENAYQSSFIGFLGHYLSGTIGSVTGGLVGAAVGRGLAPARAAPASVPSGIGQSYGSKWKRQ